MFTEMRCAGSSPCTSTSYAPVQHRSRGQRPLVTSARAVELSTGARLAYSYALRMADAGSRRGQSLPRAAQSSANLPSTRTTSRDSAEAPSTVGCPPPRTELERRALSPSLLSGVTAANVAHYLAPGAAHASEVASGTYLDVLKSLLVSIESLGAWGWVIFVLVVMVAEMVPLLPTQPLSLMSGLLFGPAKGAAIILVGFTLASINAFFIARGVGRQLAEKVIKSELGGSSSSASASGSSSSIQESLAHLTAAIESGSFWQQYSAVVLLRLTPVVPFSASNYLLGLTPVQAPAFLAGTVTGMAVWSLAFASLGGASRRLLQQGEDLGQVFAELSERASAYSLQVAGVGLGVAGAWALGTALKASRTAPAASLGQQSMSSSSNGGPLPPPPPPPPSEEGPSVHVPTREPSARR